MNTSSRQKSPWVSAETAGGGSWGRFGGTGRGGFVPKPGPNTASQGRLQPLDGRRVPQEEPVASAPLRTTPSSHVSLSRRCTSRLPGTRVDGALRPQQVRPGCGLLPPACSTQPDSELKTLGSPSPGRVTRAAVGPHEPHFPHVTDGRGAPVEKSTLDPQQWSPLRPEVLLLSVWKTGRWGWSKHIPEDTSPPPEEPLSRTKHLTSRAVRVRLRCHQQKGSRGLWGSASPGDPEPRQSRGHGQGHGVSCRAARSGGEPWPWGGPVAAGKGKNERIKGEVCRGAPGVKPGSRGRSPAAKLPQGEPRDRNVAPQGPRLVVS